MADKKQYLDQEGLERLVLYINDALSGKANIGDIPSDVALKADLVNFLKQEDVDGYIDENELANELSDVVRDADISNVVRTSDITDVVRDADIADVVRENDLEAALGDIQASLGSVYHFRGSVANLEELQAIENPEVGDVYNISDTGMNAGWTGEVWDYFGSITDLTDYLTKDEVKEIPLPTVDAILYGGSYAAVSDEDGIKAMFSNDQPEVTIVLKKNVAFSDNVVIAAGKKVNLDLDGNKISIPANKELQVNGELVIDGDGQVEAAKWGVNAYGAGAKVTLNNGKLKANESPMSIQGGAKFEMNGGELEGMDNCPLMGQGTAGNGGTEMVINGGKLIAHITSAGYIACGIYMPNNGKLVMNGGEVISDGTGLVMRAGEVELNGGSIIANGTTGVKGKVGDSRVVVGPYAVVFDESAKYPGATAGDFKLTIGQDMILQGTDGDISRLGDTDGKIFDNR